MADELISRQALGVGRCSPDILPAAYCAGWNGLLNLINEAPAVDAVLVVRCEDCKKNLRFSTTSGKHKVWCRKWRCEVKDTDFCSYGERREENAAD